MSINAETRPPQEAQLIARAKDGDERAFEALFHAHERRVYSLCARMTGDWSEAEDLTQDTFLQLFRSISTFRNESAFSTWLHRLTVNVVLMHLRRKRIPLVPMEQPDESHEEPVWREYGAPDGTLSGLMDRLLILRALGQLPQGQRAILVLHDVEGFHHKEIAKLLDRSLGNSKSQLFRARRRVREWLLSNREHRPDSRTNRDAGKDAGSSCGPSGMQAIEFGDSKWRRHTVATKLQTESETAGERK